jgi:predicted O-methyltransferase YrrM
MAKNILDIDDHYLRYPLDSWGGTDLNNPDMVNPWIEMQELINPVNVVEIGMWAGHSSLLMMTVFKNLKSLVSYDPSRVSETNARQIKKHWPQHTFYKEPIWGNEHRHSNIDLIFVDGHHLNDNPFKDLTSCIKIKPRYILMDNIEMDAVRKAARNSYKLYDRKYNPKYFFYANEKYSSQQKYTMVSPGIMGLFKMEGTYE